MRTYVGHGKIGQIESVSKKLKYFVFLMFNEFHFEHIALVLATVFKSDV